jgi:hypothetical protein
MLTVRMAGRLSRRNPDKPSRRCFTRADRLDDRRRVEWITSWTPHGLPLLFSRQTDNPNCRRASISDIFYQRFLSRRPP